MIRRFAWSQRHSGEPSLRQTGRESRGPRDRDALVPNGRRHGIPEVHLLPGPAVQHRLPFRTGGHFRQTGSAQRRCRAVGAEGAAERARSSGSPAGSPRGSRPVSDAWVLSCGLVCSRLQFSYFRQLRHLRHTLPEPSLYAVRRREIGKRESLGVPVLLQVPRIPGAPSAGQSPHERPTNANERVENST